MVLEADDEVTARFVFIAAHRRCCRHAPATMAAEPHAGR
jgi:hypothetical protein